MKVNRPNDPDGIGRFYLHCARLAAAAPDSRRQLMDEWAQECERGVQAMLEHLAWVGKNLAKYRRQ